MNQENINLTGEKLEETVRKIEGAMAMEGMPLTNEIKDNIRKCLIGESTTEEECQKVIEKYKQINE